MNQYSVWKYLLILFIVTVGIIYAVPNFYGEDPALQINSSRGFELPAELTTNIDDALLVEQIDFLSSEQEGNRLLYRFNNAEDQILAADVVRDALGDQYVVALNLAHASIRICGQRTADRSLSKCNRRGLPVLLVRRCDAH